MFSRIFQIKVSTGIAIGCLIASFNATHLKAEPLGEGWHVATEAPSPSSGGYADAFSVQIPMAMAAQTTGSSASSTIIAELAGGLENDAWNIYDYVRNEIDYVPYFGLLKGAERTLLDGAGGDADQAALLVELLIAAGYQAKFVYGTMQIPDAELANWLGYDTSLNEDILDYGGIPHSNGVDRVWVSAYLDGGWEDLDPAYKTYSYIDPADLATISGYSKASLLSVAGGTATADYAVSLDFGAISNYFTGISGTLRDSLDSQYPNAELADVLGGRQIQAASITNWADAFPSFPSTELANADELPTNFLHTVRFICGGIDQTMGLDELGERNLTLEIPTYTPRTNLEGSMIFGSTQLQNMQWVGSAFPNKYPYEYSHMLLGIANYSGSAAQLNEIYIWGTDEAEFTIISGGQTGSIPAGTTHAILIRCHSSDVGQALAKIHVKCTTSGTASEGDFTLNATTVASTVKAKLWDGETLLEEDDLGSELSIEIDHPYLLANGTPSAFADQSVSYPLQPGGKYAIIFGRGDGGQGEYLEKCRRQLDGLKDAGHADDSAEVVRQTLHVMGQGWLQQTDLKNELVSTLYDLPQICHHRLGVLAQEGGYFIDVKAQFYAMDDANADLGLLEMFYDSVMEHGTLEQLQGSDRPAVSTVKILHLANDRDIRTYLVDSNNVDSVSLHLQSKGYSSSFTDAIDIFADAGGVLFLPEEPSMQAGDWEGLGYIEFNKWDGGFAIGMKIARLNGGHPYYEFVASGNRVEQAYFDFGTTPIETASYLEADPVDMTTGAYTFDYSDFSMDGPLPLNLSRHYTSRSSGRENVMGYGWTHSFNIHAQEHSNYEAGLGLRTTKDAASFLVATTAIKDLLETENTPKGWLTASLVAQWTMDRLTDNAVSIYIGKKVMTFIEQPDGSYTPPPGMTMSLEKSVVSGESYIMQEQHGNTYVFDDNLNIERVEDPHSNTLAFAYNTQTNLETVTSSFGPEFTFGYTGDLLTSVTDNSSPTRSINYQYDSDNNLTNFVDAATFSWGVGYDSEHRVKWMKDPEQVTTIQNFYNSLGQITNQISSSGNDWDFYFSGTRNVSADPLGNQTAYYLDSKDRTWSVEQPNGARSYSVFDGQNHIVQSVAPNGVTNAVAYDVDHNVLSTTNAVGLPEQVVSSFGYDSNHHLRFTTNAVGTAEQIVTETTYTTEHKVDTVTVAKGTALETVSDYNYTTDGLTQQISEGNGKRVTTYGYDSNSQYGHPKTISSTDAGDVVTIFDIQGNLKSSAVDGKITEFNYDDRRLQTGTTYAKSTADEFSTSQTYWKNGLLKTSTDGRGKITQHYWTDAYTQAGSVFPNTGSTTNIYDEVDRLVMSRDAEGNWATNTLDEVGQIVAANSVYASVTNQFDVVGNLTNSVADPSGLNLWTTSTFDNLSRNTSVETSLSEVESHYDYLNRVTNSVDAADKDWKTEFDELGRVKKTYRPSGNYEEYGFDSLGNRTHFWNAEFKPTTFGVDAQGRVTSITNAINKVTNFVFDDAGNISLRTAADLKVTDYGYDSLNRLVAITNQGVEVATFDHDPNGNLVAQASPLASATFDYDEMNRLVASTQSVYSVSSGVQNSFDLNGNRTNIVYPGGLEVSYQYGADNRLEGVTTKYVGNTKTISFGYDTANRLNGISYPNGVNSTFGHDTDGHITSIEHGNFVNRTIIRNALGFKKTELIDAGQKPTAPDSRRSIKSHNDADQLTSEWVQQGTNEYTVSYDYSANGCLTSAVSSVSSSGYEYDYDNRLQSMDGSTEYLYDGSGARIGRIHNFVTNYFVIDYIDGLKRPLVEIDATGSLTRYYVWSGSQLLCHIEANGDVRYYHTDELSSTLALTKEDGAVTDEFAYMPYGYASHTPHAGSSDTPFQWLGGYGVYYDADTDLHLTLHRAYSSKLKRFIHSDPLGIDGGANVYAWANLNPASFVDPYGLRTDGVLGGGSSVGLWDRFMGSVDSIGWKLESWADDNRAQTQANYAQDAASYQDYMTNPKYSTIRDYSQAARSVVDKVTTAFGVYGAYKAFVPAPTTTSTALSPYRNTRTGETFQHYSSSQHADSLSGGLRPGGYATTTRGLTGAQAQSGLALPQVNPPNAVYTITPPAGTPIRVNPIAVPKFGQPGGLPEVQFILGTPPGSVSGPLALP